MKFSLEKISASQSVQLQQEESIRLSRIATIKKIQHNQTKKKSQQNYLRWTQEQNTLYLRFLKIYQRKFNSKSRSKKYKKFQKMAQFIDSKNSNQCRSHHQKLLLKYKTNDNIIEQLSIELKVKFGSNSQLEVEQVKQNFIEQSRMAFVESQSKSQQIVQQMPLKQISIVKKLSLSSNEQKQKEQHTKSYEDDIFDVIQFSCQSECQ